MSNNASSENSSGNGVSEYFNLKDMPHAVKTLDRNQKFHPDILHVIGSTPLVKLNKIPQSEGILCDMYVKCEYLNPGGSVKDRIAYNMVKEAERKGILKPGKSVIIEPTSGNTGIGLALAAAVKGYRCIIVLPEKMSDEKVNTLLALGVEIIRTPTEAASMDPDSNISVAYRLAKEIPDAVVLDQYNNVNNPLAHYEGTAEEILWAMDNDVDMVVVGAGTGGTVSGVGHRLKERCPKCKVVAVDPLGSILAHPASLNQTDVQFYEVEGIGYDFYPKVLDPSVVDTWIKTEDSTSLQMSRRLIKEEGLLCGASSGAAVWGALRAARGLAAGQRCVVILPDNIRNYMTKFISDPWMEARLFKPTPDNHKLPWWSSPVPRSLPEPLASVRATSTTAAAAALLLQSRAPLLAVVDDHGSLVGVLTADNIRRRLAALGGALTEPLSKFLVKKYYTVTLGEGGVGATLGRVSRLLDIAPFVVVVDTKQNETGTRIEEPVGVITSQTLLEHITTESKQLNGK